MGDSMRDDFAREMIEKLLKLDTEQGRRMDILSERLDTASLRIKRLEEKVDKILTR